MGKSCIDERGQYPVDYKSVSMNFIILLIASLVFVGCSAKLKI